MFEANPDVNVPLVVVNVPADIRTLLELYVTECLYEISGLGAVEVRDDGELEVTELYLLDQEVSSGDTKLSAESIAQFMAEAPDRGIDLSKVRLWWHSHAALSVYWSSTDEAAINTFDGAPWLVSIVGNHAGDYLARVDLFPTESNPMRIGQPAVLETIYPNKEVERVQEEIEAHVSKAPPPKYTVVSTSSKGGRKGSKGKGKAKPKRRRAGDKTKPGTSSE